MSPVCISAMLRFLVTDFLVSKAATHIPRKMCPENMPQIYRGPCRSVISLKLLCNFIEITLPNGCSPVNLLHILRTPFLKNTSEWLLLLVRHPGLFSMIWENHFYTTSLLNKYLTSKYANKTKKAKNLAFWNLILFLFFINIYFVLCMFSWGLHVYRDESRVQKELSRSILKTINTLKISLTTMWLFWRYKSIKN